MTDRRYGAVHKKTRANHVAIVASGRVRCAACGLPIRRGEPWDLGHVPGSASRYRGPEHRDCNRRTSLSGPRKTSRDW